MPTADELRRAIIDEHERYHAVLAGIDQTTLETEPALGTWPVRDLTAHLTGWIDALLATAAYGLGGPLPRHVTITDFDAFNAANVAAASDTSWPVVIAELDAAVERAADSVASLTDEQLGVEMDLPWGRRGPVSLLYTIVHNHHHEHIEDIEHWIEARGA